MALQAFDIVHAANLSALFKDKIQINSNVRCFCFFVIITFYDYFDL